MYRWGRAAIRPFRRGNLSAPGEGKICRKACLVYRPVTFALPPITSARDAADLMAAVTEAVATGDISPGEATEIAKVIDAYVRAYQTAELDDRVACMHQTSDSELMRIAMGGHLTDATSTQRAKKLLVLNSV
jgi:hypothetical protein